MRTASRRAVLLDLSCALAFGCTGIAEHLLPHAARASIQANIPSLCDGLSVDFPFGAAIWLGDTRGAHSELLRKHFNSITPENDMKWQYVEPKEGDFTFGTADALVAFAKANHMLVRGHNLAWHQQNPKWLFEDASGEEMQPTPENKALLLRRLENHIRALVLHYGDDVYAWDVVNEVIDPAQPDGFRRSPWFLITGTDYIDAAFRTAREVAPHAKLYINDYDTTNARKRDFLLKLIQSLKSRGVPIDGLGHQMHINLDVPSTRDITQTIEMCSGLGIDNQITELDVSVYDDAGQSYASAPEDLLVKQGYRYEELFDTFRKLRGQITGVTLWGMADDHTWLTRFPVVRRDWPLLFDARLQAKPAYWGVVDPSHLPPKS